MHDLIDRGGQVRPGEALDTHGVHRWLSEQVTTLPTALPEVTQYAGGASNWTYRLFYDADHDYILRRPPAGTKAKSAHDMKREYTVQHLLKPVYPYVPDMIGLCQDASVIDSDFYVMKRIRGMIPRANLPEGLTLSETDTRTLCLHMIDKLVELHQVDYQQAGLVELGKGAGYPQRQVNGWCDRYKRALTWNVPGFDYVMSWLKEHTPDDIDTCVIHNDWRFDNMVFDAEKPTEVIGVLDWEMSTLGDPLFDLGNMRPFWVQADDDFFMRSTRRMPTHLPGMLRWEDVVAYYLDKTGYRPDNWAFYEVFGMFRLAVIAQQIYYRYHHKQTRNPAFKNLWMMVNYLYWRCRGTIRQANKHSLA